MTGNPFASGRYSKALCDRCARKIDYVDLRVQIINQRDSGLRVCPDCLDKDHPQLQVGRLRISDPQALRQPRLNQAERAVADTPVAQLVYPWFPPLPDGSMIPPEGPSFDHGFDEGFDGGGFN